MAKRKTSAREGKAFSKKFRRAGVLAQGSVPAAVVAAKRYINDRLEVKEVNAASVLISTVTGAVDCINQIGQGDDIDQRGGNRITTKQIQIDYMVTQYPTGGSGGFVALVYDSQPNGNTAAFSDIFNTVGGTINAGYCFTNTAQYRDRFKVAWIDQYPDETSTAVGQAGPPTITPLNVYKHKRHFYKVPEEICDVRFGSSQVGTPTTGAWYIVVADCFNLGSNANVTFNVKYQYTDM